MAFMGGSWDDPEPEFCLKLEATDHMLPRELLCRHGDQVTLKELFFLLQPLQTKQRNALNPDRYFWEIDSLARTIRVHWYDPHPNE